MLPSFGLVENGCGYECLVPLKLVSLALWRIHATDKSGYIVLLVQFNRTSVPVLVITVSTGTLEGEKVVAAGVLGFPTGDRKEERSKEYFLVCNTTLVGKLFDVGI